jgi:WD40 repeat protein
VQLQDFFTMVEFDPEGKRLLVGTLSELQLIPLDGKPPRRMPLDEKVDLAAFSADGQWFAVASGKRAQVWATRRGEPISPPLVHDGFVTQVQFVGGDTLATCASDGAIRRWDLRPDMRQRDVLDAECQLASAREAAADGGTLPIAVDQMKKLWQKRGRSDAALVTYEAPLPLAPPPSAAPEVATTPPRGTVRRSNDEVGRAFQLKYLKTADEDFHAGDLVPLFCALEYPRTKKEILSAAEPTSPIGRLRFLVQRLGSDSKIRPLDQRGQQQERVGPAYVINTSTLTGGTRYLSPGQMHINMWALASDAYPPGRYRVSVEWISADDAMLGFKRMEIDLLPAQTP